jgi:hypothetical protein
MFKKFQMLGVRFARAETYVINTSHKQARRTTTQMELFQHTAASQPWRFVWAATR